MVASIYYTYRQNKVQSWFPPPTCSFPLTGLMSIRLLLLVDINVREEDDVRLITSVMIIAMEMPCC